MQGRTVTETAIHVGLMDRTAAEVKDGLKEGDTVVLSAPKATSSGQRSSPQAGGGMFRGGPRL